MSQPSKGGVGFHDEEKMERSTVRAPQPPGKKGEKKRVRKQTLHQSGILALTTPAKPRKSIFRSKLEKGMKVEEEVPPELMSPVSPLEREANPHVTCICSVVACCVQLKGDVLGATLSEMMCYAAELRALESVVNGFVEIMKGEQVTRNLGFSTRRDSSASNASLEGDLLLLEASLDELGATLCLVGEHIATQRSREDTEQTDLRASLSSDLTSLMSSVQLSRAVWRQRDMNVASIEIMAGDLLQEVNTARKALAQHDSAMPIDTSTPVQEGCTASEVPTTIQSSRRENGTQTSPCEDPEVGRLRSLLNGANRRFGEAQDELALLRTQQNEAGAGSTDTQHRRNTVMVDAEVDARATMVAATVQCGGCGADTDTQTDCRGFDIDSLERTADALRAAVKEAEDRLSHYKVRQVAEAQTHGSEEQRLLGMIAAGTKKVASLEEALVRVEKSSAAEVQRIRSDIVPRLQGEMCVMNAKYRAMLQQTADAIAGRKRAEEALQESLLKREEPQTALPCRELEELRKNMATLKEENRVLLAQLGKFKHRSVVLSRYETHSTTLCKELQEERNTTGQLKTECAELSLRCSKVEDQSNTAQQALSQCAEKYNSQLSVVENAKQEIASLQKCIEHLKEAEPDTRVLDGLRVTEELGKLYKETSEELLQLKVSEADLLRLRERNAELTREVSEGAAKIAVLTKEKERKRALEKEAGRVPTLKKKIEELSFAVEKGEWDKKVANTHHDEELAKCAAVIAELQHDIGVLRGEVDAEEVQENKPFDD